MKNQNVVILLTCFAMAATSCMTASKFANKRMDPSIIPADFDPNRHIILLAEMPRRNNPEKRHVGITKKLDKAFKKYYKYRYEIVSPKEIFGDNEKYSDTSVYKFAVLNALSSFTHSTTTTVTHRSGGNTSTHSVSPSASSTTIDFYFYDRVKKKEYPETNIGTSLMKPATQAFTVLIDRALAENGKKK